jgi:hypothetical protein
MAGTLDITMENVGKEKIRCKKKHGSEIRSAKLCAEIA